MHTVEKFIGKEDNISQSIVKEAFDKILEIDINYARFFLKKCEGKRVSVCDYMFLKLSAPIKQINYQLQLNK